MSVILANTITGPAGQPKS